MFTRYACTGGRVTLRHGAVMHAHALRLSRAAPRVHLQRCRQGDKNYPIFLPPRSLAQAAFIEALKRPGVGRRRRTGVQIQSLARACMRHRQGHAQDGKLIIGSTLAS
jgi:hypothetical protein